MARDPRAARLAARLVVLYAADPTATELLARVAELHTDLVRRLAVAEHAAVEAAQAVDVKVTGSPADPDDVMAALAGRLHLLAGRWRRRRKAHLERLRRIVEALEADLDYADPVRGIRYTLASGRVVDAVQWVGPDEARHVEGRGEG